ncbi:MAG: pyridoxamine 5'-phosphate oxidase family protein [Pseudomonadota bacterium]
MTDPTARLGWDKTTSPFHDGERIVQDRVGVRALAEAQARRAIRSFMPRQHRDFYGELATLFVGHVDDRGRPWASILAGSPGFLTTPDERSLAINAAPLDGDPLAASLREGAPLGLLGMEMAARRRNRMNGRVSAATAGGVAVTVDQSFGNCPQYITTRGAAYRPRTTTPGPVKTTAGLDKDAHALIRAADTFWVATHSANADDAAVNGVDMSHRGGRPGFVKIDGDMLLIPDFPGNKHFNTLGNIHVTGQAGLLFVDFTSGDVLMATGAAEILWDAEAIEGYRGAERAWRVTVEEARRLPGALPIIWSAGDASPNSLIAGTWDEAAAARAAEAARAAWRPFRIEEVTEDSETIRSFRLAPADGEGIVAAKPGQHLPIRLKGENGAALMRTYTLTSIPEDGAYRISVKRDGAASSRLHDAFGVGAAVEARAPNGGFVLDAAETRPVLMIAGGVGITPMLAMTRAAAMELVRTRHLRPITVVHAARTGADRAFAGVFQAMEEMTKGAIRYVSVLSRPAPEDQRHADGRIDAAFLRRILPLDDYDVYLCGPPGFMQAAYDAVRTLGVNDARIFAEAFGPSALSRRADMGAETTLEAEEAEIVFSTSGLSRPWRKGDAPILDVAEAVGLTPEFSCRGGSCGMCAAKLKAGAVAYRTSTTAPHGPDEALICCAVPASARVEIEL